MKNWVLSRTGIWLGKPTLKLGELGRDMMAGSGSASSRRTGHDGPGKLPGAAARGAGGGCARGCARCLG